MGDGGCQTPKRPGPIGSIGTTSRGCGIPRSSWIWVVLCQTDHQHCQTSVSTCEGASRVHVEDLVRKGWKKVPVVWGADAEP